MRDATSSGAWDPFRGGEKLADKLAVAAGADVGSTGKEEGQEEEEPESGEPEEEEKKEVPEEEIKTVEREDGWGSIYPAG